MYPTKFWLSLPLSAGLILTACSGDNSDAETESLLNEDETETALNDEPEPTGSGESVLELEGDTVATVNGQDIPMEQLEMQLQQYELMFAEQGIDFAEEENLELLMQIQQGIVDELVQLEVLVQEADRLNFEADENEVQVELEQIRLQFDDFEDALEAQGYTEDMLENEIRDSLKLNQLLADDHILSLEIEVTDEEIEESYEQQVAENPEINDLEDVRDAIEIQLIQTKYIDQLYDEADIDIHM
ncbi:SurA N-terminal domain-containing protein [Salisediminibacterium beveridgei]|nr:SurA N-terminal domain-containing protein [Salisediminibacterium beveridgei]